MYFELSFLYEGSCPFLSRSQSTFQISMAATAAASVERSVRIKTVLH
jgi:hypothetical protein